MNTDHIERFDPLNAYSGILERFSDENRLRQLPEHLAKGSFLDLTTNDYLGLGTQSWRYKDEFRSRFGEAAMSASASRLLASDQQLFFELERYLARAYGASALLFNSGYHANVGIVSALNIPGTLWVTDKLVHASVIDGLSMARADNLRWRHNDTAHLEAILQRNHDKYDRLIVVCESVYSMDGDMAPLREIAALKQKFPRMMLYVDEAHSVGVFGPSGLGLCVDSGLLPAVDLLIGTLGKACASTGAFAITSSLLRDFLVNCARSFIFSTALPPANAAWSLLMLEKIAEMDEQRNHLVSISAQLREAIEELTGEPCPSRSPIVPLVTHDAAKALRISAMLRDKGILACAIRRPTVPPGGERIRFSLNASLTGNDVDRIVSELKTIYSLL